MKLIKETALFTALLHCVLANALPNDYPTNPYIPVSYIPDKGILPTPYSEVDKIDLPRPPYGVTPSWHHIPFNKPEVYEEEKKSQPKIPSNLVRKDVAKNQRKPELDIKLHKVKLGFAALNGMVSEYKKDIKRPAAGPEPPTVIIKPGRNRSQPDDKNKLIEYKDGQPMFKPEDPGMLYKKDNSYRYTTPARLERPRNMDYTKASEIDYGQFKAEEQSVRSYKNYVFNDVKLPNFDHSSHTSKLSYDDTPGNAYRTGPLKSQSIHTSPYNGEPVAQKPTYNYQPTQSIVKEDKQVELPPVPKTMSLLRRVYITLLNTISGFIMNVSGLTTNLLYVVRTPTFHPLTRDFIRVSAAHVSRRARTASMRSLTVRS